MVKKTQTQTQTITEDDYIDDGGTVIDALTILKTVKNLCLIGETGVGKTKLSHHLKNLLNIPLFEITLSVDTNRWELIASDILTKGETQIREGIVLMWLKAQKGILLINGFNYAPANVISLFESLADWTNKIYIPELQKEFVRTENHYLIVTMNPYEKAGYCLEENSLVSTGINHQEPIDKIKIGNTVLNQHNKQQKVINTATRNYNGQLYTIKGIGLLPFGCSDNHKFLVATRIKKEIYDKDKYQKYKKQKTSFTKHNIQLSEKTWVEAQNLTPHTPKYGHPYHCLIFPKLKEENNTNITLNRAFLLGLFVAQGSTTKNDRKHQITWCLGTHKTELIKETKQALISEGYTPYTVTQETGCRISICSKEFYQWIRINIGTYAINKHVPINIMESTKQITQEFLRGYIAGDGSKDKRGISFKTISKELALQIQKLFSRLNMFVCLDIPKIPKTCVIKNKIVKRNTIYQGRIGRFFCNRSNFDGFKTETKRKQYTQIAEDENNFYLPIKQISKQMFEGILYDISTEDETFQVSNIIAHNSGTHQMNIATMRRFEPMFIHYLTAQNETKLIQKDYDNYNWVRKLVEFAGKTRILYREGKLTMPLTTGNLSNYAKLKREGMTDARIISIATSHYLEEERATVKRLWEDTEVKEA